MGHRSKSIWRRCRCRCHRIQAAIQGCEDSGGYHDQHLQTSGTIRIDDTLADPEAQLLKPDWLEILSWVGWDPVDMWWDYWMLVSFGERGENHVGELDAI